MPFFRNQYIGPSRSRSSRLVPRLSLPLLALQHRVNKPAFRQTLGALCAAGAVAGSARSAQAKVVLVAVKGRTTGSETYLRARPDVTTPPVAKVAANTPVVVWGKFGGWYRVETSDHFFGWVYYQYLTSPELYKVKTLSKWKADEASNRTSGQLMFGSPALLKTTYQRFHAVGALKGLKNRGIILPGTVYSHASRVRLAQLPSSEGEGHKAFAAQPHDAPPAALATGNSLSDDAGRGDLGSMATAARGLALAATAAAARPALSNTVAPAMPDLASTPNGSAPGGVAMATPEPRAAGALFTTPSPAVPSANLSTTSAPVAEPAGHLLGGPAVLPHRVVGSGHARRAVPRLVAKPWHPKWHPPVKVAAHWVTRHTWSPAVWHPSKQANWRAYQRQQLRVHMGIARQPVVPMNLAPVSPADLLKAREAYLAARRAKYGSGPTVASSAAPTGSTNVSGPASASGAADKAVSGQPMGGPVVRALGQLRPPSNSALSYRGGSWRDRAPQRGGSPREEAASRARQGIANQAVSYRGMPYVFGAASPGRGFDCSGLVYFLLRRRGFNPPRTAAGYRNFGTGVAKNALKPGDLVLFANTYKHGISHIGVYMGNGKFVHASTPGSGVRVDSLFSGYYGAKYFGARRIP